jgi:hypothetical protein
MGIARDKPRQPDFSVLLQKEKKIKSSSMAAPGVEIAGG